MLGISVKSKGKRRPALTRPTLDYLRWRYISNGIRTWKARRYRPAYVDSISVADELREEGIVVGTTDRFLDNEGRQAFLEASKLVLGLSRRDEVQSIISKGSSAYKKDYLVQLVPFSQRQGPESPLLRLGLDKKLLEIVSLYLGMWPRLHAVGAWLNFPSSGESRQSQLWHRDPEDVKNVKVFIYLNDIDINCGPFCYIPRTQPFGSRAAITPIHRDPKRITDEEMRAVIPAQEWLACIGPAGTMILADTIGFHRGGNATSGNRLLITFTYTSGAPFTKRNLELDRAPEWASQAIQRYALPAEE